MPRKNGMSCVTERCETFWNRTKRNWTASWPDACASVNSSACAGSCDSASSNPTEAWFTKSRIDFGADFDAEGNVVNRSARSLIDWLIYAGEDRRRGRYLDRSHARKSTRILTGIWSKSCSSASDSNHLSPPPLRRSLIVCPEASLRQ